jgi:hypothetical protein
LVTEGCTFLFKRLKPGIIFTATGAGSESRSGSRDGSLGLEALQEIKKEFERFGQKITWFIDCDAHAGFNDFENWTDWIAHNQSIFSAIHVCASSKNLQLTVAITRHISSTGKLITIYDSQQAFASELAKTTDRACFVSDWINAQAVPLQITEQAEGITIENDRCSFSFAKISANSFLSEIRGKDDGSLGNTTFDYLHQRLVNCTKPATWFVDVSAVQYVGSQIPEAWIYWITNNQKLLERVVMLTPPGALPILINIERTRLIDKKKIVLCQSKEQFIEMQRKTSTT